MSKTFDRKPISLDQLHQSLTSDCPRVLKDPVTIQNNFGPNLLRGGHQEFIFAIVANLSSKDLTHLTTDLNYSEI